MQTGDFSWLDASFDLRDLNATAKLDDGNWIIEFPDQRNRILFHYWISDFVAKHAMQDLFPPNFPTRRPER